MLRRLGLRDFVIVAELEIELRAGYTALTGETGAGKSILIDALQFVLGARAEAGLVREGAARTEIHAEFDAVPATLRAWLDEAGLTADEAHTLLVRRQLDTQGRGRAWINGHPATMTQLRALGDALLDIHGQHAWQSLTRATSVRELLDAYAGIDPAPLQSAWTAWRAAQSRLDAARQQGAERERERERLQWQISELDKLAPGEHEWDELNAEHQRLSHAQGILDGLRQALDLLGESEVSADRQIERALGSLDDVAAFEPRIKESLEVLRSAQAQLQDASHTLHGLWGRTELDPARLAELDARLSAWIGLARRYRRPPEDLPATLTGWRRELAELDAATDLDALEQAAQQARAAFLRVAEQASSARHEAAPRLADAVTTLMQDLGMRGGRFAIGLDALPEPQAHGLEQIEFLVAGHAGSTPRPLAKVASGGELSRIALAIAVTTSALGEAGTLIFDEVDSGIGGAVAHTVGQLMHRLGHDRQVLAVTHLAQVAACADLHLLVSKQDDAAGHATTSIVTPIDAEARVREIARMLGGTPDSDTSLAHAREMLGSDH